MSGLCYSDHHFRLSVCRDLFLAWTHSLPVADLAWMILLRVTEPRGPDVDRLALRGGCFQPAAAPVDGLDGLA